MNLKMKRKHRIGWYACFAFVFLLGLGALLCIKNAPPSATPAMADSDVSEAAEAGSSMESTVPTAQEPETASQAEEPSTEPEPVVRTVRFSAVGDNLIHGSIYLQGARRAQGTDKDYDFTYLYQDFAPFLQAYDVNFINQETLVTDEIAPATYPCFATPGEIGREIYRLGWRVFGTSNNHIYDQGAMGIASTLRFWAAMPEDALTVGLYRDEADYGNIRKQEINGVTIAYLAYTEFTNGIPTPSNAEAHIIYTSQIDIIEQQLHQARQEADVVVVSVHWGVEDSHTVTDAQRALAVQMGNWGADVILGTHPHVVQTLELLADEDGRTTLCAYSLGNFVSAQSRPDELIGIALSFQLSVAEDGMLTIDEVQVHPTVTAYDANYSNIHVMLLRDYTEEAALQHGVRAEYPAFDRDYICQVIRDQIPEEYINWED